MQLDRTGKEGRVKGPAAYTLKRKPTPASHPRKPCSHSHFDLEPSEVRQRRSMAELCGFWYFSVQPRK